MALVNIYADTNVPASGLGVTNRSTAALAGGTSSTMIMRSYVAVSGTDNVQSVYRMFKNVDANIVPVAIRVANTAMTSLAISIGLYRPNLSLTDAPSGTGKAIFLSATSIAAGAASLSAKTAFDGMVTYWAATGTFTKMYQQLYQIAGDSLVASGGTPPNAGTPRQYDICITVTTTTAVAGVLAMEIECYQG